jgi:F-type H+-transporting ATPase subunit alpha
MLKQAQYSPMKMEEQVVAIFACTPSRDRDSWVRPYRLSDLGRYEQEMLEYVRSNHGAIFETIASTGKLEDDVKQQLVTALDSFAGIFQPSSGSVAA